MYTLIRTLLGGALVLAALTACGASSPTNTAPADTGPTVLTAVPLENQTAYPAPPAAVPAEQSVYPGAAPSVPDELPSAYPG